MDALTHELDSNPVNFELNRLIEDVPFGVYQKADGMNASGIKDFLRSPAHYYQRRYNRVEDKQTDALLFGRLLHFVVLEPELFKSKYTVRPKFDKRTTKGKEAFEEWETNLDPNAIVVPEQMVDDLVGISNKISSHPLAQKLLKEGVRETTMFWNDRETGELCKMRPDFVSKEGHIIDLKSSMDAREDHFRRDIMKYKYEIQAAHYCAGARETGMRRSDSFIFLVVEKEPPYEIAIYPAGASVLGVGDQWRAKAMRDYAKCKRENKWPGYNHEARMIELPPWAEAVDPNEESV